MTIMSVELKSVGMFGIHFCKLFMEVSEKVASGEEPESLLASDVNNNFVTPKTEKTTFENTNVDVSKMPDYPETKKIWYIFFPLQFVFAWMIPLSFKGFFNVLLVKDLPRLPNSYQCSYFEKRFLGLWNFFEGWRGRLWMSSTCCFWFEWLYSHVIWFIYAVFNVIYPVFLNLYLRELQKPLTDEDRLEFEEYRNILPVDLRPSSDYASMGYRSNDWVIWIWLISLVFSLFLCYVCMSYGTYAQDKIGMKMRVLLSNLIYKKIFKLTERAKRRHDKGRILSYLASDCYRISISQYYVSEVWTAFPIVVGAFYFLVRLLGVYVLFSLIIFVFVVFLLWALSSIIVLLRTKHLKFIDSRMGVMREGLQNILVVKFFNLQSIFLAKIFEIRKNEVKCMRWILALRGTCNTIAYSTPPLMTLCTFIMMHFFGESIDIVVLISALTYFTLLRNPLADIGFYSIDYVISLVSLKRIEKFLMEDEREEQKQDDDFQYAVEIQNGTFSWLEEEKLDENTSTEGLLPQEIEMMEPPFLLKNLNLKIDKGKLIMITGKAKSGISFLSFINKIFLFFFFALK